jgi:hypothetical protein
MESRMQGFINMSHQHIILLKPSNGSCIRVVNRLGYSIVSGRFYYFLFVVLTLAILSARALKTHQWYLDKFPQFPKGRKSMIPFMY